MSTRAIQIDALLTGLVHPTTGAILDNHTAYFYEAGTSTAKAVWTEKEKTNPYTEYDLGAVGQVQLYAEGNYKIVIREYSSDDTGTIIYTWDNMRLEFPNYYVNSITSNHNQATEDDFLLVDTTSGDITISMLSATVWARPLKVRRISGTNSIIIDPYSTELIDGASTLTISTDAITEIVSDGTELLVSGFRSGMSDADGDTQIIFDENLDEDIIRFDAGGTQDIVKIYASGDHAVDISGGLRITSGDISSDSIYFGGTEITATAAEINTACDGITATAADLNQLDGETAILASDHPITFTYTGDVTIRNTGEVGSITLLSGQTTTSAGIRAFGTNHATYPKKLHLFTDDVNAITIDENQNVDIANGSLGIGGVALTATPSEINTACDGITATAAEINTACDGITATATEINTACDGITATAAEINTACDGITATAAELNQLDGEVPVVLSDTTITFDTTGNLVIRPTGATGGLVFHAGSTGSDTGMHAFGNSHATNPSELDLLTNDTIGIHIDSSQNVNISNGSLSIGGDTFTATPTEINTACDGITATAAEINAICDGMPYHSYNTTSGVTITTVPTTIASISVGTVVTGDIFLISGYAEITKDATADDVYVALSHASATAGYVGITQIKEAFGANEVRTVSLCGFAYISGGGTIGSWILYAACDAGQATVASGDARIQAVQIKNA